MSKHNSAKASVRMKLYRSLQEPNRLQEFAVRCRRIYQNTSQTAYVLNFKWIEAQKSKKKSSTALITSL